MRVKTEVVQEVVDNDGCREGEAIPIHPMGIVRLALDLLEARERIRELEALVAHTSQQLEATRAYLANRVPAKPTVKSAAKRTKKKT